jgi:hypothetical protein
MTDAPVASAWGLSSLSRYHPFPNDAKLGTARLNLLKCRLELFDNLGSDLVGQQQHDKIVQRAPSVASSE